MALPSTMYTSVNNSPATALTADIAVDATSFSVVDGNVLLEGPGIAVIGDGNSAEIITYTERTGDTLSGVTRGVNGTVAAVWAAGTSIARNFTAYDHEAFKANLEYLETNKSDDGHNHDDRYYTATEIVAMMATKSNEGHTHDDRYYTETEMNTALAAKADLAKEIMYFTAQTVSTGSSAQIMRIPSSGTNSSITTDTVVLECTFAAPANITSNVSWQSYAGYIAFTGTCTAATTANVTLGTKGNS